jgi:hypothetical protein
LEEHKQEGEKVMKVQIMVDGDQIKTVMSGGGTQAEIGQVIFQTELLKFKLLRMLDDDNIGDMFVARGGE